jgi:hypothetical protein
LARKFSREEIILKAADYDQSMKYPWDIMKKVWELGLSNYHIPQHCGELYTIPTKKCYNFSRYLNVTGQLES